MSAHMRKRPTRHKSAIMIRMTHRDHVYEVPLRIIEKYRVEKKDEESVLAEDVFKDLDRQYTKAGALLKGLRYREGLNQITFAKRINVTQSDLSKMENGKRRVGRILAKRISKAFGINYRSLLE